MCLIAEIASLIFGIIALATGKFSLTRNKVVQGASARIVGIILCLPLPLALGAGIVLGVMLASKGKPVDAQSIQPTATILELVIFIVCFGAAVTVALATAKAPRRKRRYDEGYEEDDEEEYPPRRRRRPEAEDSDEPRPRRRRKPDDNDEPPRSQRDDQIRE